MRIGGLQKNSMIDFPGRIAAVVFTQGCSWRCAYCHNASLVVPERFEPVLEQEDVWKYLRSRVGRVDGVVISGGEPTLQPDLLEFIQKAKAMGYDIKLDSNGIFPDRLKKILDSGLVDYVAMDVKATLDKLSAVVGVSNFDPADFSASMEVVRSSGVDYEFRTTVCPEMSIDPVEIARTMIQPGEKYYLQAFKPSAYNIDRSLSKILSPEKQATILEEIAALDKGLECDWR